MLSKRIIACLDVRDGRVVKGVSFEKHVDLGSVTELARRYVDQGVDELVFYDITASPEQRSVDIQWIETLAQFLNIPFCVAGGIDSVDKARGILYAGADKISVNSPAIKRPQLISELSETFGSQCVVVGVDSQKIENNWWVWRDTGKTQTIAKTKVLMKDWILEVQRLGAGEIVLNCMSEDGRGKGYDLEQLRAARSLISIPLIASGGAGRVEDFAEVFEVADVDGALAAGVFHRGELTVGEVKNYLADAGFLVRL